MKLIHECRIPEKMKTAGYGVAINACWEYSNKKGELWVGNGEYSNQVLFCPFCGYQPKKEKK